MCQGKNILLFKSQEAWSPVQESTLQPKVRPSKSQPICKEYWDHSRHMCFYVNTTFLSRKLLNSEVLRVGMCQWIAPFQELGDSNIEVTQFDSQYYMVSSLAVGSSNALKHHQHDPYTSTASLVLFTEPLVWLGQYWQWRSPELYLKTLLTLTHAKRFLLQHRSTRLQQVLGCSTLTHIVMWL